MKDKLIITGAFLLLTLCVIMVWQRQTIRELKDRPVYFSSSDTIIQNIQVSDTIYPAPVTLVSIKYDTIRVSESNTALESPSSIEYDTIENIIADYYAVRSYQDVLIDTDSIRVYLDEEIALNRIKSRKVWYDLNIPERTITNTVVKAKHGVYFNVNAMSGVKGVSPGIDANLIFISKRDRVFTMGGGYFHEPYIKAGIGFKF